jgi:hypothetical protein
MDVIADQATADNSRNRVFLNLLRIGLLSILLGASHTALAHCAGQHTGDHPHCAAEEPPEPPPDGSACADAPGAFPAAVYTKVILGGKRGLERVGTDFYLSNSTGDCAIKIFTAGGGGADNPLYVQSGTTGRLVWAQRHEDNLGRKDPTYPIIRTLEFEVVDKEIVSPLPANATTLVTIEFSSRMGILSLAITPDQQSVYFTTEESHPDGWLDRLRSFEIASCEAGCYETDLTEHAQFMNQGVGDVSITPSGDRVYLTKHDRVNDIYSSFFADIQQGGLSDFGTVATHLDSLYAGRGITAKFRTSLAFDWDYNGDGAAERVLAVDYWSPEENAHYMDIIDVTACSVGLSESCLSAGYAHVVRERIDGGGAVHNSWSANPPNLIIIRNTTRAIEVLHPDTLDSSPTLFTEPIETSYP